MLSSYSTNSEDLNHAIVKMLYRIAVKHSMAAMLYQISVFKTMLSILQEPPVSRFKVCTMRCIYLMGSDGVDFFFFFADGCILLGAAGILSFHCQWIFQHV